LPVTATQVEDSSHRTLQENTENCWNMEAVFQQVPDNFLCFPTGTGHTSSEKFEKLLTGMLLPQNHRNYPKPAVSGPDCSTWGQ
jgi:hypothetical protein